MERGEERGQKEIHPSRIIVTMEKRERDLLEFINSNSIAQSLLYDLDLLPEQIDRGTKEWAVMVNVVLHIRQAQQDCVGLKTENQALEKRVKELESRPIHSRQ